MTTNDRPLRVAIVDPDARALDQARGLLGASRGVEVVSTASRRDALAGVTSVDVIVIDISTEPAPIDAVRDAITRWPDAAVVVTAAGVAPSQLSRAVAAGARAFVLKPYAAEDLPLAVRDAHDSRARVPGADRTRRARGRIVAIYSPKGGVGSTTIATNLAVALARGGQTRVALCDLDLQFGDIGSALDVRGANSVLDLVSHAGSLDATVIAETFVRHDSGVDVLLAPEDLSSVERVDPAAVADAVEQLRAHFGHVVCDTWSSLDQLSTAILDAADDVVVVTTPELPAVRDVRRALDHLGATGERAHLVINRAPGKASLGLADVEAALGRRAIAAIPSDGEGVTRAINRGVSLFHGPGLRISRHYRELADALVADTSRLATGALAAAAVRS